MALICDNNVLFRFNEAPALFSVTENAPTPLFSVPLAPGKLKLFAVMDKALLFELIVVPLPTVKVPKVATLLLATPLLAMKVKAPLVLMLLVTLIPFVAV